MRRGDIVQLNSGGTKMTVFSFVKDLPVEQKEPFVGEGFREEDVVCKWFVGTTLKKDIFRSSMLKQVV
ncbi:DUF2158 domain-containing protein [Pleionea mediterranea]|jgi:uncharacterized protein YodC (DUF2158 family)|uniref:Uncharacterized protein DUF2158 n=1 Tax=Pleionea mediterranea TaxID=523701 RepID=A0A316FZZ7_9GAMM|nr:DUF2158 domain-containing protein [Pleionea mediterranea]PWK54274.1 uncharacterized protein DUF2158 [Pleionea mediterranea]